MRQIYDSSPSEIRELARAYLRDGILSRVALCYERLMHLGLLRRREYLRFAFVYTKQGKERR